MHESPSIDPFFSVWSCHSLPRPSAVVFLSNKYSCHGTQGCVASHQAWGWVELAQEPHCQKWLEGIYHSWQCPKTPCDNYKHLDTHDYQHKHHLQFITSFLASSGVSVVKSTCESANDPVSWNATFQPSLNPTQDAPNTSRPHSHPTMPKPHTNKPH